ncbi:MAG: hypothetical protein H7345_12365 [Rubritepida sp.]|nr:hypothetical protein [Rubritepida sp.]
MTDDELEKLNFADWPISDNYLIEVGRINTMWSNLESFLQICIGKLSGFNESHLIPFVFLQHSSFPQKIDMLGALCDQQQAQHEHLKDFKRVIGLLRAAQAQRNKFIHNSLGSALDGSLQMPVGSARGMVKTSVETVSVATMRRVTIQIDEATGELYKLILKREILPKWKRLQSGSGLI